MAGTNRNNKMVREGPVIVLAEPQLGENIGMVARAMANFGLHELRLVNPRDGWPNEKAVAAASKATHVVDNVKVYDKFRDAMADIQYSLATTARPRDMLKEVMPPDVAVQKIRAGEQNNVRSALVFGRERWGLNNEEIALCDAIVTFPVNPAFASLNIAQAVLLMSYEWMNSATHLDTGFSAPKSELAEKEDLYNFFDHLEGSLEEAKYFYPAERRERMTNNLRSIFSHAGLKKQELQTLHGVVAALERRWIKKQNKEDGG